MVAALKWKAPARPVITDVRTRLLIQAAEDGDCETIKALVAQGTPVDAETETGTTALMKAAACGRLAAVRTLLDLGAAINKSRPDGFTPLIFSVFFGCEDVVSELLKRGADIGAKSKNSTTPKMWAAARGFKAIALLLLAAERPVNRSPVPVAAEQLQPKPLQLPVRINFAAPRARVVENTPAKKVESPAKTVTNPNDWEVHDLFTGEGIRRVGPLGTQPAVGKNSDYLVSEVPPFSPISALVSRIGGAWKLAAATTALAILIAGGILAASWRLKHRQDSPLTQQSIPSIQSPATQSSGATLQTATQGDSATKTATSQAEQPTVAAPATAERSSAVVASNERQPEAQIVEPVSRGHRVLKAHRRSSENVSTPSVQNEADADANRPAAVTFVTKTPAPQTQRSRVVNDLPAPPVAPLAGSSSKKRIIQWP